MREYTYKQLFINKCIHIHIHIYNSIKNSTFFQLLNGNHNLCVAPMAQTDTRTYTQAL